MPIPADANTTAVDDSICVGCNRVCTWCDFKLIPDYDLRLAAGNYTNDTFRAFPEGQIVVSGYKIRVSLFHNETTIYSTIRPTFALSDCRALTETGSLQFYDGKCPGNSTDKGCPIFFCHGLGTADFSFESKILYAVIQRLYLLTFYKK